MFFKSVLIAISVLQFCVCQPVLDIPDCVVGNNEKYSNYIEIDCQGRPKCTHLQSDINNETHVYFIVSESCEIVHIKGIKPDLEQTGSGKTTELRTFHYTVTSGLNVYVITDYSDKLTLPSSLEVEASKTKWFEYDGEDDEIVQNISMINAIKLEFFSMENGSVAGFSDDFFINSTDLKVVFMPSNKIESIDSVRWPNSVKWLDVSANKIDQLSNRSFENLDNLQVLSADENSINEIKPGTFSKLNKLMFLSMQKNHIGEIKKGFFDGLGECFSIELDENNIENIEAEAFDATPKLTILSLSGNKISHVDHHLFNNLHDLALVNFSSNPIDETVLDTFANLTNLESLYLSHCELKTVDFNAFAKTRDLGELDLSHNKIDRLVKMSSSQPVLNSVSINNKPKSNTSNPFDWVESLENIGKDVMSKNVRKSFGVMRSKSTSLDFFIPNDLNPTWDFETINLSENRLTVIEKGVFAEFRNLDKLYLSKNPITTLYPESFAGLDKLEQLYLNGCKLTSIDFAILAHLTKLEFLDLSQNQLTTITLAPLPSINDLYLNDNQLTDFIMQKNDFPKLINFDTKNNNNLVCTDTGRVRQCANE